MQPGFAGVTATRVSLTNENFGTPSGQQQREGLRRFEISAHRLSLNPLQLCVQVKSYSRHGSLCTGLSNRRSPGPLDAGLQSFRTRRVFSGVLGAHGTRAGQRANSSDMFIT